MALDELATRNLRRTAEQPAGVTGSASQALRAGGKDDALQECRCVAPRQGAIRRSGRGMGESGCEEERDHLVEGTTPRRRSSPAARYFMLAEPTTQPGAYGLEGSGGCGALVPRISPITVASSVSGRITSPSEPL